MLIIELAASTSELLRLLIPNFFITFVENVVGDV